MTHIYSPDLTSYRKSWGATLQKLNLWLCVLLLIVQCAVASAEGPSQSRFPGFRHVDPAAAETTQPLQGTFVLAADADFAPWSFVGDDGELKGITVELSNAACADAGLACSVVAMDFARLLPALQAGEVQGIVSGLKLDDGLTSKFAMTRPFYQSLGHFVMRNGSPLNASDVRTLAGRRVGFRANTTHARFLERFYNRSALTPFESDEAVLEALRTGQVDAAFGDAVRLSFWLSGNSSRGCCAFLGKAYVDRSTFSRSLSFLLRRDAKDLRAVFDTSLDRLETSGATAEIFARYLPTSVW